jgi:NAD(P)H-flavin reductase
VFTLFFFFHCDWVLTSAQFFVATLVLFAASWLHRNVRLYLEHGVGHKATVSVAANGFVRVVVPTQIRWSVGQHFFVRFTGLGGLHFLGTHPFSACSLPVRAAPDESPESELVFLIRPQGGLTARLAKHAEKYPEGQLRVLLDGPYAGINMETFAASDRTLVIAGGSGAGWALPFIAAFLRCRQIQPVSQQKSSSLRLILATRDLATQTWFEQTVAQEFGAFPGIDSLTEDDLSIEIFYTGDASLQEKNPAEGQFLSKLDDPEKQPAAIAATNLETISSSGSSTDISISKHVRRVCCSSHRLNRPLLPSIIAEEHEAQLVGSSMSVYLCGPLSMQKDVANAVAARQAHVLQDGGVKALELEVEHFSWA